MTAQELLTEYAKGERNFNGVNLANEAFKFEVLSGADFSGANLINTDFYGADVTGCNFSDANLTNANFYTADVLNAIFDHANLYRTCFECTHNYMCFIQYEIYEHLIHCIRHDSGWMLKGNEFWSTLEEFEDMMVKVNLPNHLYNKFIEILKTL